MAMDVDELIGHVAAKNGIRLDPNDPAFALVTLNQRSEGNSRGVEDSVRTAHCGGLFGIVSQSGTEGGKGARLKTIAHALRKKLTAEVREIAGAEPPRQNGHLVGP